MSFTFSYFCGWLLTQGALLLIREGTRDHKNVDETGKNLIFFFQNELLPAGSGAPDALLPEDGGGPQGSVADP